MNVDTVTFNKVVKELDKLGYSIIVLRKSDKGISFCADGRIYFLDNLYMDVLMNEFDLDDLLDVEDKNKERIIEIITN